MHAAAKISHRAQGIASVASRWHALVTCTPNGDSSYPRVTSSSGNLDAVSPNALLREFSESDLDSLDNLPVQTNTHLVSYMSSYHKRQALGTQLSRLFGFSNKFLLVCDGYVIKTVSSTNVFPVIP